MTALMGNFWTLMVQLSATVSVLNICSVTGSVCCADVMGLWHATRAACSTHGLGHSDRIGPCLQCHPQGNMGLIL